MPAELTEINRKIVHDMYVAAKKGDFDDFFAVISPDVVVAEPPFLPYGGVYRGVGELQKLFGQVTELLDISTLTVDRIVADGDRALGFIRVGRTDGSGDVTLVETSLIRHGIVVEMEIYFHDAANLPLRSAD